MKRARAVALLGTSIALGAAGLAIWRREASPPRTNEQAEASLSAALAPPASAPPARAAYVGARACAQCHAAEVKAWTGSHHDLAMQEPTAQTVLGNFDGATFAADGSVTQFSRRGEAYFVRTGGPDGKLADFRVRFALGVLPLQQYLVELPGGRLQALRVAWDSRPKREGGQRWFHLNPGERMAPSDPLHWTRLSQNANHMCIECHATKVQKGYDAASGVFRTTWSEPNVACEACHGPGSRHLAWAADEGRYLDPSRGLEVLFDERRNVTWRKGTATASRSVPRSGTKEIDTCASCHSRRATLSEAVVPGQTLLATHLPTLLTAPAYHPDGQILEEDYEYGSFLQSKMFARGVTCSDCHEPHGLGLRAAENALCGQCHEPGRFDTQAHHFHQPESPGSACVSCHMPEAIFMNIDGRRDHSLRVPRPDLSRKLGVPNPCSSCHEKQGPAWADARLRAWLGEKARPPHYGETFFAARSGAIAAGPELLRLATSTDVAPVVRATAVSYFPDYFAPPLESALPELLRDPAPLVRYAAASVGAQLQPAERARLLAPLTTDPVLAVRIEAARVLAGAPHTSAVRSEARARAEEEYLATLRTSAEDPQSWLNLGLFELERGHLEQAAHAYETALRLEPTFVPAYVNLADLERSRGNEAQARATLAQGREQCGEAASIEHALGLSYVRSGELTQALPALEAAARLSPSDIGYGQVLALARDAAGDPTGALRELERVRALHPSDRGTLRVLLDLVRRTGEADRAEALALELIELERAFSFE